MQTAPTTKPSTVNSRVDPEKIPGGPYGGAHSTPESHIVVQKLETDKLGGEEEFKASWRLWVIIIIIMVTRLNPIVSIVFDHAIEDELPQTYSWAEVKINDKLLRIIAKASGRVFIRPELCSNEQYLDTSINFTIDVMKAVFSVAFLPVWMRYIVTPLIPFVRTVYRRMREVNKLLLPVIQARKLAVKNNPLQQPDDMLDWLIREQTKAGIEDDDDLIQKQLGATFAAIHTTSQVMMHVFYTLAAEPEIASMLRDEVREVLAKTGGEFTAQGLQDMKKLDSFVKELLRFHPLQSSTSQRRVVQPIPLSNGQVLPAGVIVEAPNAPVCGDAEIFEDPHVFDPLRFYKVRQTKDAANANSKRRDMLANSQLVSSSASSLTWGYGRHACPGRFFAANEIKMVTGKVLMQYEIKLPDGVTERYPDLTFGDITMPDPSKAVMLRRL
ncbi:cytochrome P450 [Hypoxylon sp. FL1857]|nr:cytochrome P450 [Hypoxylon sp. FL1857]